MKIKDIRNKITNETRTDGRYPLRIGSEIELIEKPEIDFCLWWRYVTDNQGNPKSGTLRTSLVTKIEETATELIVHTINSIYVFEK